MEVIMKTEMLCVFADLGVFARNPASTMASRSVRQDKPDWGSSVSRRDAKVRKGTKTSTNV